MQSAQPVDLGRLFYYWSPLDAIKRNPNTVIITGLAAWYLWSSIRESEQTAQEQQNTVLAKAYVKASYHSPTAAALKKAVTKDCEFVSPADRACGPCLEYAKQNAELLKNMKDLHVSCFGKTFAKGDQVCLRYTVEGTHNGDPRNGVPPTGRSASWTVNGIVEMEHGKVKRFVKEWDKTDAWKQLGWVRGECEML